MAGRRFSQYGIGGMVPLLPVGGATGKFLKDDGTWATPAGGGGGTTDHAALAANLLWTTSGHTGAAYGIPAFSASGAARVIAAGSSMQLLGVSGSTPTYRQPQHDELGTMGWSSAGHTGSTRSVATFDADGAAATVQAASDETMLVRRGGVLQFVPLIVLVSFTMDLTLAVDAPGVVFAV